MSLSTGEPVSVRPVGSAIEVAGLTKRYDGRTVVDSISFEVRRGECFGILGPNGAGKTTTLEMVEGLRRPDGGTVSLLGTSPWPRDTSLLRRIGVQLQATAFIEHLTSIEQLRTVTDLYGVPATRAEQVGVDIAGHVQDPALRPTATSTPSPAGSASACRSPAPWCTDPRSCSSTSPRPDSTRALGATCGMWSEPPVATTRPSC